MSDERIWLIDASAIIRIKTTVPESKQWELFKALEVLVEKGQLAFPRQIKEEVSGMTHPDAPGVWVHGVFSAIKHPTEPGVDFIRKVMASEASAVVDPNKTREDGDPFLIAMALELAEAGHGVCIVTNDCNDTADRIGLSNACDILEVDWITLEDFLKIQGLKK